MKIKVNPDAEQEQAPIHPEGTWDATIVSALAQESRAKDPQIVLTWKTSQGKLKSWLTYIDKYPNLFVKPLLALGFDKSLFDEEIELDDLATDLVKKRALIDVVHKESNKGNMMANIEAINPVPEMLPPAA